MADHVRQQIREEVRSRLTALPNAADPSEVPLDSLDQVKQDSQVPCAVIDITGETLTWSKSGDEDELIDYARTISLTVWLCSTRSAGSRAIELLEQMAVEVEHRLAPEWNRRPFILESVDFDDDRRRGEIPFRSLSLNYSIVYQTAQGDATTLLD